MEDGSPKRSYSEMMDTAVDEIPEDVRRCQSPLPTQVLPTGCDSPRSVVAERMQSLELRHDLDWQGSASPSPRKRAKIRDSVLGNEKGLCFIDSIEGRGRSSSPSPRHASASSTTSTTKRSKYRSPPPLLGMSSSSSGTASTSTDDSSPSDLTWKFAEITGASIDVNAGDDGEGMDGVGFRPPPQIAYARRQRRKQQVSDWKMREAREARQRRFEKRQGCKLQDGGTMRTRSVRFAEMLDPFG